MVKENRQRLEPITYYYRQISVMVYSFFCFLFSCHSYCIRIVKIKAIFQTYKYLEDKVVEMTFALSPYRPPKPCMEVRYAVNVHSRPYQKIYIQDPVYDPIVLQVSGNSTPIRFPHVKDVKMTDDGRWLCSQFSFYLVRFS